MFCNTNLSVKKPESIMPLGISCLVHKLCESRVGFSSDKCLLARYIGRDIDDKSSRSPFRDDISIDK